MLTRKDKIIIIESDGACKYPDFKGIIKLYRFSEGTRYERKPLKFLFRSWLRGPELYAPLLREHDNGAREEYTVKCVGLKTFTEN